MRMSKTIALVLNAILLMSCGIVPAAGAQIDLTQKMQAREYRDPEISRNIVLPYRIYVPSTYDENQSYRVLLWLHGNSGRGEDNSLHVIDEKDMTLLLRRVIADEKLSEQFIVVAPQCPSNDKWVDAGYYPGYYALDKTPQTIPSQLVMSLMQKELPQNYNIDPDRIYISGISMGGYGTWDLICRYPDFFAAAMPVCGGADPLRAETISHMPIWTAHSQGDSIVRPVGTNGMVKRLTALEADITYTNTDPHGHDAWMPFYQEPTLLDWMVSKTRIARAQSSTPSDPAQSQADNQIGSVPSHSSEPDQDTKKAFPFGWLIGAAAAVAVIGTAVSVIAIKKRKKKQ